MKAFKAFIIFFWDTTKKYENKNLSELVRFVRDWDGKGYFH